MAITTALATSFKKELLQGMHTFTAGGTFTGVVTNAATTCTSVSSIANLIPGMGLTGTNIAASTFIATIISATSLTLSVAATGSSTPTITYAGDTYKIALYTSSATMDSTTTAYSATNEVSGTGYTAAGNALTNSTPTTTSTTAFLTFTNSTWTTATITARGSLIYNTRSAANRAVVINDFGGDKTSTAGDFTVVFPTNDSSNAIIRIA